VRFRTIDLKSHPLAQFTKNCIIQKRTHNIHKIKHKSKRFLGIPAYTRHFKDNLPWKEPKKPLSPLIL